MNDSAEVSITVGKRSNRYSIGVRHDVQSVHHDHSSTAMILSYEEARRRNTRSSHNQPITIYSSGSA